MCRVCVGVCVCVCTRIMFCCAYYNNFLCFYVKGCKFLTYETKTAMTFKLKQIRQMMTTYLGQWAYKFEPK